MTPTTSKRSEAPDSNTIGFLGDNWVPRNQMMISIEDLGFRQGVTAVERLRTYHQTPFAVDAHLERWQHSTAELGLSGLPVLSELKALIHELLRRNQVFLDSEKEVGITLFATPGTFRPGSQTFGLHVIQLNFPTILKRQKSGQPLVITDIQQPSPQCWPRSIKARSRMHYFLADAAAQRQDPAASGVLIDEDSTITETSISNIAIVKNGRILSPPRDRVLRGFTQTFVEERARELGIQWTQSAIPANDLLNADEVLLMGTDGGLWFADQVNGKSIRNAHTPAIYPILQRQFQSRLATNQA